VEYDEQYSVAGLPAAPSALPAQPDATRTDFASWGRRVGAYVLDGLVMTAGAVVAVVAVRLLAPSAATAPTSLLLGVVFAGALFVLALLYPPALMARAGARNGQTLGKQWLGIRSARDNGKPYGYGSACVREVAIKFVLFGMVGSTFVIPWVLDVLWPLWDRENRTLHDMLAQSHVVTT